MYSSALYTLLGLLSGLFYREMTKAEDLRFSQLNVTHTFISTRYNYVLNFHDYRGANSN